MPSTKSLRVWIVTGANSGFGLAIATHVLAKGDKAIATVRSLDKFPQSLRDRGAHPLVLDLSATDSDIRGAAENALQVYGHVDALVNNAGWGMPSPWEEADLDEVRAQFQTIFFGTIAFTQGLLSHFRTRRTGHILNVSSVSSTLGSPSWGANGAAKAALEVFTDSLRAEMALFGVRVHSIVPGYFPTSFMTTVTGKSSYKFSEVYTDPSQGYDSARATHESAYDAETLGDVEKLAARIYEVVSETGLAGEVMRGVQADWTLIPLGADCEAKIAGRLEAKLANVRATEPIWRSVNMDTEKQQLVPREIRKL